MRSMLPFRGDKGYRWRHHFGQSNFDLRVDESQIVAMAKANSKETWLSSINSEHDHRDPAGREFRTFIPAAKPPTILTADSQRTGS